MQGRTNSIYEIFRFLWKLTKNVIWLVGKFKNIVPALVVREPRQFTK